MTRTNRYGILGLSALLITAGCASLEPPADLLAYQKMAANERLVAQLMEIAPEAFEESKQYEALALAACDSGKQDACEHNATLARMKMDTALEQLALDKAQKRTKAAKEANAQGKRNVAEQMALKADYDKRIVRMERIDELKTKLAATQGEADAHKTSLQLKLEQSALEAERLSGTVASQQEKLDVIFNRSALFDDAVAIVGPENVKQTYRGIVVTFRGLFAAARTTVTPSETPKIEALARLVQKYPAYPVMIEGHTDSRGARTANLALSNARAQAIMDQLVSQKVQLDRVRAIGYGPDRPVSDNRTAQGREANRRIDVHFMFTQVVAPAAP